MKTPTHETEVKEFRDKILDVETAIRLTYNEQDSDKMVKKMLDWIEQALTKAKQEGYTQGRVNEVKTCQGCAEERRKHCACVIKNSKVVESCKMHSEMIDKARDEEKERIITVLGLKHNHLKYNFPDHCQLCKL